MAAIWLITIPLIAPAQTVVNYPGAGVLIGGELWDSFLPANRGPFYSENTRALVETAVRIGNFDRLWSTPTHMWPGGWTNGNFWGKGIEIVEFDPDPSFNPPTIGGVTNPSYYASSGSNYAYAAYANGSGRAVKGAGDPTRDYARETRWVDASKRHHLLYEAAWPTTIGVDVKLEVHQFTVNWNSFNDFIIVNLTLTNTGEVDLDANGVSERTGNIIDALAILSHGEFMCSHRLNASGSRSNALGAQRGIGYIGDSDPKGAPWDMTIAYPAESAAGVKDMGLNDFSFRAYTDVWSGWSWIGVKGAGGQTKLTLFGTHPIGTGAKRGWYASAGHARGLSAPLSGGFGNPRMIHIAATGTWYADGGKARDMSKLNLAPNPNFFASGTAGVPTTFVPLSNPSRPNGDRKLLSLESGSAFEVPTYESRWTTGYSAAANFDGDVYHGVGPFQLGVGETITATWAEVGGYRLEGIQNAMAAARWAYDNNLAVPEPPPAPDVLVTRDASVPIKIFWDNRAEAHPGFAGYKIYKASGERTIEWLQGGMLELDEYWRSSTIGPTPGGYRKAVNPNFSATSYVAGYTGTPGSWGPYELARTIPKADLATYSDASQPGYAYSYAENALPVGTTAWYYVAAYGTGSFDLGTSYSGYNSASTSLLESSNLNRNGASGLWVRTYPFAISNPNFPTVPQELKEIGAGITRPLPSYPSTYALNTEIYFPQRISPSAFSTQEYRIVGLPGNAGLSVSTLLSGTPETHWRVSWDDGGTSDFIKRFDGSLLFTFVTGRAFWMLSNGPVTINASVPVAPLNTNNEVPILLHSGWNLITNPYTLPVQWLRVQTTNGISEPIYAFAGTYSQSSVFAPYTGYYYFNATSATYLRIPYAALFKDGAEQTTDPAAWRIGIRVNDGERIDSTASCGCLAEDALPMMHSNQHAPRFLEGVPTASFHRPDLDTMFPEFATDVRVRAPGLQEWPFEVRATQGEPVDLTFTGLEDVPSGLQVWLVDDQMKHAVQLRQETHYPYTQTLRVCRFTLLVGESASIAPRLEDVQPTTFAIGQNFPNPFNASTSLFVQVPRPSEISVTIYNTLGAEIRVLHDGLIESGRHWLRWDGCGHDGSMAASGVYIVRMKSGQHLASTKMLLLR